MLAPTRGAEDLFAGWWQLIHRLGAVPRVLVWDGEGAVGRRRHRKTELTQDCQGFRGTLGAKVLICNPADPEAKGIIERNHDYLETSFLPGRSFAGPDDFNRQLSAWIATANTRRKRVLGCAPADRIDADRHAMLTLPPVPPVTGWRSSTRLARDHYIRLDSNDYSVHPAPPDIRADYRCGDGRDWRRFRGASCRYRLGTIGRSTQDAYNVFRGCSYVSPLSTASATTAL